MTEFCTQHIRAQKPAPGMRRFFSPANLDRYRKLASGAIGEAEQHQLLEDLAAEMNAFRREARVTAVNRPPPLGGAPGVKSMFDVLKTELQLAMKLAGCASIKDLTRKFVT